MGVFLRTQQGKSKMAEGPFIPISQQHSSNSKALWDFGSYGKSNRKSLLYETEVLAIQDKLPWYAEKWRDIKEILPCVWCIFMVLVFIIGTIFFWTAVSDSGGRYITKIIHKCHFSQLCS